MGTVTSTMDNCLLFACARDDGAHGEDEYPFGTEEALPNPSHATSLHDGGLDDQLGAIPMIGSLQEEIERIELEVGVLSAWWRILLPRLSLLFTVSTYLLFLSSSVVKGIYVLVATVV